MTIVCPFFGDQPFWGRRVYELDVGSMPVPQKRLTVDNLVSAIHDVVGNRKMRRNADALGKRIRDENGIAKAVGIIEEIAFGKGR